jgi:molecular chaperone IbpA
MQLQVLQKRELDMTLGNIAFGPAFKDMDKFFVGFDDQFNRFAKLHDDVTKNIPNYPPYNIKKTGDTTYVIELAVAGFAKQDIEIELADGKMVIKGNVLNAEQEDHFLFKGIANRAFTRTFALEDQIEVKNAEMFNGMLQVFLERIIPDHKKPKKIEVKEAGAKKQKVKPMGELLLEEDERNL